MTSPRLHRCALTGVTLPRQRGGPRRQWAARRATLTSQAARTPRAPTLPREQRRASLTTAARRAVLALHAALTSRAATSTCTAMTTATASTRTAHRHRLPGGLSQRRRRHADQVQGRSICAAVDCDGCSCDRKKRQRRLRLRCGLSLPRCRHAHHVRRRSTHAAVDSDDGRINENGNADDGSEAGCRRRPSVQRGRHRRIRLRGARPQR